MMIQETGWKHKKSLRNLIHFHWFYYHKIPNLHNLLSQLLKTKINFLTVTYLWEIFIKVPQRYVQFFQPNLLLFVIGTI
jgi:hypothetical protein